MTLDPVPGELNHLKRLEKVLKILIMHQKGEFPKFKRSICNIAIKAANRCNILPKPAVSNRLIVVKLKQDLKYKNTLCTRYLLI